MNVTYTTGSGNKLMLDVNMFLLNRGDVPLVEHYDRSLCGDCKGYNGGCIGLAPNFQILKPSFTHLLVLSVEMDMAWAIAYAYDSGHVKQSNYYRLTYADRLTESYIRRILSAVTDKTRGFPLGAGNCSGCGTSKMCGVVIDGKCLHPDKRTYSLEATGIDCSALCKMVLGHRLWWWYRDELLPRVMNRFAGVLLSNDKVLKMDDVLLADKACKDQTACEFPAINKVIDNTSAMAPDGCVDAGMVYNAYKMR